MEPLLTIPGVTNDQLHAMRESAEDGLRIEYRHGTAHVYLEDIEAAAQAARDGGMELAEDMGAEP